MPSRGPTRWRARCAFLYIGLGKQEFVVFQVKFSRNPAEKSERDLVIGVIATESEKISKLVEKGATHYYLITNIRGTSHPEVGSIDLANKTLSQSIKIPSQIWWRDDLDSRVDNAPNIKWSYAAICSAVDLLPFLVRTLQNDDAQEPARAITGYMAKQYAGDRDVKFKQVDLSKKLTDLFVDIPLRLRRVDGNIRRWRKENKWRDELSRYFLQLEFTQDIDFDGDYHHHSSSAATFLLNMPITNNMVRLVIEGAPGQGKSTVTQYICQVNRLKLLRKHELSSIPVEHQNAPVRTPFRVDLRDYAAWVSGRHPFAMTGETVAASEQGRKSLERFLTMQVAWFSGGLEIRQNDLLRFLSQSHSVIVLDGFDEVADIETRHLIVDEICDATERLHTQAQSIQIIVTSRPAAFANSPGFPEAEWTHLELSDLRRSDIEAYKEKWIVAQSLNQDDSATISNTLDIKIQQPHLRDLARNPMQLAILLQLIHVQGAALPDKRTTLYEKYMELFFNREAEKSTVVRDYRDLLMSIHGYLGWILQTQAEAGSGSGSIRREELSDLIKAYLNSEQYEASLAEELLRGMVERVVALVSRVEGTYEFEVQPLREYFTAKHLYETAPYSPAGREKKGTRPERFEAIARNSYWTNVTRFFCGFYDKGELPSLVDAIAHLSEQNGRRLINQPRRLALMLLSDWVFAQSPRAVKQLILHVTEEPAFQRILAADSYRETNLPERSGQKELRDACISKLASERDPRRRRMLRRIVANNCEPSALKATWKESRAHEKASSSLLELCDFGIEGIFPSDEIAEICAEDLETRVDWLTRIGRHSEVVADESLFRVARDAFFKQRVNFTSRIGRQRNNPFCLEVLSAVLAPHNVARILSGPSDNSFIRGLVQQWDGVDISSFEDENEVSGQPAIVSSTIEFAETVLRMLRTPITEWKGSLTPWTTLVDRGFQESPGARLILQIGLISTAVRARDEKGYWSDEAWKSSLGLVRRLRFARMKSGQESWWRHQIENTNKTDCLLTCLTVCIVWVTSRALSALCSLIIEKIDGLSDQEWSRVASQFWCVMQAVEPDQNGLGSDIFMDAAIYQSTRLSSLVIARVRHRDDARLIGRRAFGGYRGGDRHIYRIASEVEVMIESVSDIDWDYVRRLSLSARAARCQMIFPQLGSRRMTVPDVVASDVLENCDAHVLSLVTICEKSLETSIAKETPTVSETASDETWFQ